MLALAGIPLGFRFRFLEPAPGCPACDLGEVIRAKYDDPEALIAFGKDLRVVTYEFENVPAAALRTLESVVPVLPPPVALAVGQDRLREKEVFAKLGIPTPAFKAVNDRSGLDEAVEALGLPAVLKTRQLGYDGKGQCVLREPADVASAWELMGGVPVLLEAFVKFRRELSVVSVRGARGEIVHYPLGENVHEDGILRTTRAPAAGVSDRMKKDAEAIVTALLEELGHVGVLAVELFDTDLGFLANEIAPRVHNSGHWTQDGAVTSQFENHIRAITGLPLGSPEARGWSVMVNLIGEVPDPARIVGLPGTHLHLYGKEPRPGRKVGHVNLVAPSPEGLEMRLALLDEALAFGAG
jgi:5-(carboxyamino)imidazole ribonucleotide synthase